jgi:hypothetical protein
MTLDEAFKLKIVDQYASFTDEMDIYCGIKRDDVDVLNALASEYEKAGKALFQELPDIPKVADLDLFSLQTDKTTSEMLKRITKDAFSKRLPQQRKDAILQQSLPTQNDNTQQKLSRPQIQNDLVRWVMALRAYSHALKNLEFIDGNQKTGTFDNHTAGAVAGTSICNFLPPASYREIGDRCCRYKIKGVSIER